MPTNKTIDDLVRDQTTLTYVLCCIENEGWTYCFESYSDFKSVKDEKFQQLLENHNKAKEELEKYIRDQSKLELDSIKNRTGFNQK